MGAAFVYHAVVCALKHARGVCPHLPLDENNNLALVFNLSPMVQFKIKYPKIYIFLLY